MDVDGQVNADGWLKPGLGWHWPRCQVEQLAERTGHLWTA